jgi:hypothetical protein
MAVMFNVENASITPINHKIIVLLSFSILSMSSTLNDANPLSIFSVSSTLNDASPPFHPLYKFRLIPFCLLI